MQAAVVANQTEKKRLPVPPERISADRLVSPVPTEHILQRQTRRHANPVLLCMSAVIKPAPNVRQRVSALGLTLLLLLNTLPAVRSLEQMEENMSQQVRPALLDTLLPNQAQASKV